MYVLYSRVLSVSLLYHAKDRECRVVCGRTARPPRWTARPPGLIKWYKGTTVPSYANCFRRLYLFEVCSLENALRVSESSILNWFPIGEESSGACQGVEMRCTIVALTDRCHLESDPTWQHCILPGTLKFRRKVARVFVATPPPVSCFLAPCPLNYQIYSNWRWSVALVDGRGGCNNYFLEGNWFFEPLVRSPLAPTRWPALKVARTLSDRSSIKRRTC